jgi:hypothetical protein
LSIPSCSLLCRCSLPNVEKKKPLPLARGMNRQFWIDVYVPPSTVAGGMGQRAQQLFAEKGIRVVYGVPSDTPETVVKAFLDGTIVSGKNLCDH